MTGEPAVGGAPGAKSNLERRVALYSTVDQVLASVSNALLLFSLARVSTVAEFGLATLFVAAIAIWTALARGALGTPILLVSGMEREAILSESGHATTWSAVTFMPAVILLLGLGLYADDWPMAISFAIAAPAVIVQDVLRYVAIALGSPRSAAFSDGLWALIMLLLYSANLLGVAYRPEVCVLVWGGAGIVSTAILMMSTGTRPMFRGLWNWWSTHSHGRLRFGVVQALIPASTMLVTLAVTALAGASVTGGLRGATTLFGPITIVASAVPLVILPRARRAAHTPRQQWSSLVKAAAITSGSTVLLTAVLMVIPVSLGRLILGDTWEPAVAVAPYIGLSCAVGCWMYSAHVLFQGLGLSALLLRVRMFQIVLQLTLVCVTAAYVGSTLAVSIALLVSSSLTAVIGVVMAIRTVSQPNTAIPDSFAAGIAGQFE